MKLLYLIVGILFLFTACTRPDREQVPVENKVLGLIDKNQFKIRAYRKQIFDHTPGGEDSYDQGFQDGCQTATNAMGDGFYRLRGPKIDADRLVEDSWYQRGFQDASSYCTFAIDWETH